MHFTSLKGGGRGRGPFIFLSISALLLKRYLYKVSASNRNEYQVYFLEVKAAGA